MAACDAEDLKVQTLFDTMNEGFCLLELICDATGRPYDVRHLLANPAYERQTNQKLTDIIGRTARELHPGIEPYWIEVFGKVAQTGEPAHFESEFGSLGRWFQVRAYQVGPRRVALMFFDVTLHREMVERLRQQAIIFNSTEEGIVITDVQGHVIEANPAFERSTEYTLDELRGQKLSLLRSGRQDSMFYQNMWAELIATGRWQGEIWNRRKSGDVYIEWISISAVRNDDDEVVNYIGTSIDLSRMNHAQSELERLAHHDALTNMPNRLLLISRLEHAIDRAKRNGGLGAVLFIDLDRFKQVNDSLGHTAGDELLKAVARRVKSRLRDIDTLARLGGDEFVILLDEVSGAENAAKLAQDLIAQLATPFSLTSSSHVEIGASIGIALFPVDGTGAAILIRHADQALYAAKAGGRGGYRFYSNSQPPKQ